MDKIDSKKHPLQFNSEQWKYTNSDSFKNFDLNFNPTCKILNQECDINEILNILSRKQYVSMEINLTSHTTVVSPEHVAAPSVSSLLIRSLWKTVVKRKLEIVT